MYVIKPLTQNLSRCIDAILDFIGIILVVHRDNFPVSQATYYVR